MLKRIGQYCAKPDFKPEMVGRVSFASKSLCMWVRAMEVYGRIYRVVEPKKKVRAPVSVGMREPCLVHTVNRYYLYIALHFPLSIL